MARRGGAPKRQRIPGAAPETERALNARIAALESRLARLEAKPGREDVVTSDTKALPGEFITFEAPTDGLSCLLPAPTPAIRNARATLCFRNANPVRIVCVSGLVNGAAQVVNTAAGTIECVCDGKRGWATYTGLSASGSATDAEYVVGAAHGSLPNGRVATDSTEIDADVTAPNVISWALRTASVVFSKLANLTGLSVLGRAANSAGVMAAITATELRQVLRVNAAGTDLEWGDPVRVQLGGATQGDAFNLNLLNGTGTTAAATVVAGSASLSFGWNGTSSLIPDGDKGDITVGSSGTAWTIDSDVVSDTKLRNSGACSVIGRSANSTGDPADISAASNDTLLRRVSNTLSFGQITVGMIPDNTITLAKLATQAANTVLANATGSSAAPTAVALDTHRVLGRLAGNIEGLSLPTMAGLGLFYNSGDGSININPSDTYDTFIDTGADAIGFRKTANRAWMFEDFDFIQANSTTVTTTGGTFMAGESAWFVQGMVASGSIGATVGVSGHPGIVQLATGGTSGNGIRMWRGSQVNATEWVVGSDIALCEFVMQLPTATSVYFGLGFENELGTTGATLTDAIEFYFDTSLDTTIHAYSEEANTGEDTDTGVAPGTGWRRYTIRQDTVGTIDFYIDDALEATHSTRVPDAEGLNLGAVLLTRTNASRSMNLDYVYFESQPLSR